MTQSLSVAGRKPAAVLLQEGISRCPEPLRPVLSQRCQGREEREQGQNGDSQPKMETAMSLWRGLEGESFPSLLTVPLLRHENTLHLLLLNLPLAYRRSCTSCQPLAPAKQVKICVAWCFREAWWHSLMDRPCRTDRTQALSLSQCKFGWDSSHHHGGLQKAYRQQKHLSISLRPAQLACIDQAKL